MIIYCIVNKVTNKKYVGQTIRYIKQRWMEHVCNKIKYESYIHNAIKKYGKENFEIKQIDKAISIEDLNTKEKYWIKELGTIFPNGYNLTEGGSQFGKHLGYAKIKMSDAWKTRIVSEKTKEKMRKAKLGKNNHRFGKHLTKNQKELISLAVKSVYIKENHPNFGKSSGMLGKSHTKETKQKMGMSQKGRVFSKQTIEKMRQSALKRRLII